MAIITTWRVKIIRSWSCIFGATALFHIVGVTPEAKTKFDVLMPGLYTVWKISYEEMIQAYSELSNQQSGPIDAVVFGSPHLSVLELSTLAKLTKGRRSHPNVDFIVTTSRYAYHEAQKLGIISVLERFGIRCLTDTCSCFLDIPTIPEKANIILTQSAKYAHYGPGLLQKKVYIASVVDCVESAVSGYYSPKVPEWMRKEFWL